VIGDAAYSGKSILKLTNEQGIKVVSKLNPSITQGFRKKEDQFDYNKDADMFVCQKGYYKEGSESKTYSVIIKSDVHKYQLTFHETDYFKKKWRIQKTQDFRRTKSHSITNMQMQRAIAIFAVNLKRFLKLS
jgi:hypothetical protein